MAVENSACHGALGRLPPAVSTELAVDLLEVAVHRLVRDAQAGRDLLVPEAPGEQVEDLQLAGGQAFELPWRRLETSSFIRSPRQAG